MPIPGKHNRQSTRLRDYDYSKEGAYFITICTYQKEHLFAEIKDNTFHINEYGKILEKEWLKSEEIRSEIKLDTYQIMPNHFHAILFITNNNMHVGANGRSPLHGINIPNNSSSLHMKSKSLSSFIAGLKSSVTTKINKLRETPGTPIWQRNYYDHIIRSEKNLQDIRQYIKNNPVNWLEDIENQTISSKGEVIINYEHYTS